MKQHQANVINKSDIQKAVRMNGFLGKVIASMAMDVLKLNKVNAVHRKYSNFQGPDFAEKVLGEVGVMYDIKLDQLDYIPVEGPFITISNHNYGSIDGLMLSTIIGHIRPDYKMLTNFILSMIPALKESFIAVDPFGSGSSKSVRGLKLALDHIASGGSLGLFPAGEVATTGGGIRNRRNELKDSVTDIPWPPSMIKLIKSAGVPVIPIYFDGTNSRMFHILGKIHPRLRTIRLVREMFNKRGRVVSMRIGKPISPAELEEYSSIEELGGYLRSRVYCMQQEFVRQYRRPAVKKEEIAQQIALPRDKKAIIKELDRIKSKRLFSLFSYECYLADYDDIPNTMLELGRLREETFRAVGEGTNHSRDIDEYDKYYKHLILWDSRQRKIAGAYRIGIGSEIMSKHGGRKGFYTSTLFDYKIGIDKVLPDCAELGRSFVRREYQKESLALMLLFRGLMFSMMKYPEVKYFIGPVSISNDFPRFYKSLMVYYFTNMKPCTFPARLASPTCPFITDYIHTNPEDLLRRKVDSVEKFDRFLLAISDGRFKMPTLVKRYFKCNAQLICFNVDPEFNYSLDGLILMPLKDFPKTELLSLLKSTPSYEEKEAVLNRFGYSMKG